MFEESLEHCLRECEWSFFFWNASPLILNVGSGGHALSIRAWFEQISKIDEHAVHSLFAILFWINWKKRNMLVFQHISTPHQICFDLVLKLQNEIQDSLPIISSPVQKSEVNSWQKPLDSFWKVNVDASVNLKDNISLGVVIRDMHGKTVVSRSKMGICPVPTSSGGSRKNIQGA
ncbi:hypothetical protein C2S52_012307 [Perilla frutescens var. hirtella]|nr:hypothetical protein C2S52_012307 [Perilla frutescens var. hirtella]